MQGRCCEVMFGGIYRHHINLLHNSFTNFVTIFLSIFSKCTSVQMQKKKKRKRERKKNESESRLLFRRASPSMSGRRRSWLPLWSNSLFIGDGGITRRKSFLPLYFSFFCFCYFFSFFGLPALPFGRHSATMMLIRWARFNRIPREDPPGSSPVSSDEVFETLMDGGPLLTICKSEPLLIDSTVVAVVQVRSHCNSKNTNSDICD